MRSNSLFHTSKCNKTGETTAEWHLSIGPENRLKLHKKVSALCTRVTNVLYTLKDMSVSAADRYQE